MTDQGDDRPDLEKLAQQYMDLWQKQLEGLAGDTEVADMMARTLELMSAGPAAFSAMGAKPDDAANSNPEGKPDPGAAPPAAAHGAAQPDVPDLARRLDELERRVKALEAGAAGGGGDPSDQT